MVFWDSRTIHCGVEPRKGREQQNFRCVVYLCYTPRSLSTEKELKKKKISQFYSICRLEAPNHFV